MLTLSGDAVRMDTMSRQEQGDQTRAAIMRFISEYRDENDVSPSLTEIAEGVGLKSHNAVRMHLLTLSARGEVSWIEGKYRTIRVVET